MIQQINVMQQTIQPTVKQANGSTGDNFEKHLVGENGKSDEITVNKYGNKVKFGMDIGSAELGEYFTKEQIEEWTKSIDNVDAPYSAFLTFVSDAQEHDNTPGKMSMNYLDFRYLLEQGEIIDQQNVGFTEEYIYERNWDFSVMLTETFGIRNTEQNKQHLDIIRSVMDLGMVSKDKGLMSPEDVRELLAKKKFQEQQLLLERAFEKKHLLQQQLQSNV